MLKLIKRTDHNGENEVKTGEIYKVVKSTPWADLMVGETYRASVSHAYVCLHNVKSGVGTYVRKHLIDSATIILQKVRST